MRFCQVCTTSNLVYLGTYWDHLVRVNAFELVECVTAFDWSGGTLGMKLVCVRILVFSCDSCFYLFTMWKRYWHLGMITRKINSKLGWCSYLEHATHSTKCVFFSFDDQKYWVHLDRQQKEWSCRNTLNSCSWYCACNYTTNLIKITSWFTIHV